MLYMPMNPYLRRLDPYVHINAALPDPVPAPDLDEVGMTPLHWAIFYGDEPAIDELFAAGANIDTRDLRGRTPLHVAADNDRVRIIKLLLNHGANIEARDEDGYTPLHHAASGGMVAAVYALLDHGANIVVQNNAGQLPYQVAEVMGYMAVRNLLLPPTPEQVRDFLESLERGNIPVIIQDHPGIVNARGLNGNTLLHGAAFYNMVHAIQELLARNANRLAQNNAGQLPYQIAEAEGHMAAMNLLLPLTTRYTDDTFFNNVRIGNVPVIIQMVQNYPGIVYIRGLNGNTPLHVAAAYGQVPTIRALLDRRANIIEVQNLTGNTPLHIAAAYGQVPAIRALLALGANRAAQNSAGQLPYQVAEAEGHIAAARDLLPF